MMKIKEHMNMKDDQYICADNDISDIKDYEDQRTYEHERRSIYISDNNDIGNDDKNLISLVSEFLHRWKLLKRSKYWKERKKGF